MIPVNDADLTRLLIEHGSRLLVEKGPSGLTLRAVAAAAGTSTMSVYSRFGDKEGLLVAMHREGFRRLAERLSAVTADPAATLLDVGRAYRRAALDSPNLYALMFGPARPPLELSEDDLTAAHATFTALAEGVRVAVGDGDLHGDPDVIARHLWIVAHGAVSLELAGHLPVPAQQADSIYDEMLLLAAAPFFEKPVPPNRPTGPYSTASSRIEIDDLTRPAVRALLAEHLADMRATSPAESVHALDLSELTDPAVSVWTAWDGEDLLGIAALKQLTPEWGELKSMRTVTAARGRGVAAALLDHVLTQARARRYARVSLETGTQEFFAPARRLYRRAGFVPCGPFAEYKDDPSSVYLTVVL